MVRKHKRTPKSRLSRAGSEKSTTPPRKRGKKAKYDNANNVSVADTSSGSSDCSNSMEVDPDHLDEGPYETLECIDPELCGNLTVEDDQFQLAGCRFQIRDLQLMNTPVKKFPRPATKVHLNLDSTICGELLSVGEGGTGQLGLGASILERKKPQIVDLPTKVVQVCAGGMHSLALGIDGIVYSWGCNDDFALGRSTAAEDSEFTPAPVALPLKCIQISAGDSHSAALLEDGSVFVWGTFRDGNGVIGLLRARVMERKPVHVDLPENIKKISSGSDHVAALSTEGSLYTFGNAQQGQLGRVARIFSTLGGRSGLEKLLEPSIVRCQSFFKVRKPKKFSDVWCGQYSTFVKEESSGRILACGLNNYFQIGHSISDCHYALGPNILDAKVCWKKIAGGLHHTLALSDKGKVYAFGRYEYGRLGLGTLTDTVINPTLIETLAGEEIVDIACGSVVSFAVSRSGDVYSWGMGTNKQTGHGEEDIEIPTKIHSKQLENRRVLQVSAGGQHTLFIARERN